MHMVMGVDVIEPQARLPESEELGSDLLFQLLSDPRREEEFDAAPEKVV